VDEHLKKVALDKWGTPQFDDSIKWQKVKPDTKQMVAQWFVKADLEAFFNLFTEQADERRFNFWIRYLKQIKTSQLFFSKDACIIQDKVQHRKFLEQNKGRYSYLNGTKSSSNAFMIQIGNMYIVEFSETGNACYFYKSQPSGIGLTTELSSLKNKYSSSFNYALSHRKPWERRFNQELQELLPFRKLLL
jgi:hypothetical protein